ncbi:hypothetical protein BDZ91DRAFT_750821 [Kalaharituber pfeilii]|nr:hypothetical protein BDZ91DRAFT_750821 [Kalaharituber pfeilii]
MTLLNYILLVSLTALLLVSNVFAQTELLPLDETLRRNGLDRWADFLLANPHPIYNVSGIVAFAPANSAVDAYLRDYSIVLLTGNSKQIWPRENPPMPTYSPGNNDVGKAHVATDMGTDTPGSDTHSGGKRSTPQTDGSVFFTGVIEATEDPINAKVLKHAEQRKHKHWGEVTSGGGQKSRILCDRIQFQTGWIYPVDRLFVFASTFATTVAWVDYHYLNRIFDRMPAALNAISCEKKATFFAPTPEAFWASGLDVFQSTREELQAFLDDHTIISDFIGYTPRFQDGTTYMTKSGKQIEVKLKGHKIFLNDSRIVDDDYITSNGVIQIIDKVLTPKCTPCHKCTSCHPES